MASTHFRHSPGHDIVVRNCIKPFLYFTRTHRDCIEENDDRKADKYPIHFFADCLNETKL